jgi:hypothetical protein
MRGILAEVLGVERVASHDIALNEEEQSQVQLYLQTRVNGIAVFKFRTATAVPVVDNQGDNEGNAVTCCSARHASTLQVL